MKKLIYTFLITFSVWATSTEESYYDILETPIGSSPTEIRQAYRKKAQFYHPDRNKSSHAENMMKKINEAYEVLKDPNSRLKYDQEFFKDKAHFSQTEPESSDVNFEDIFNF